MSLPLTPSQTVGPFLAIGLPWPDGPFVVPEGTPGAITISGRVLDGAGEPVPDALVETWQAAPDGSFAHPDDPRGPGPAWRPGATAGTGPGAGAAGDLGASVGGGLEAGGFRGFGRCPTGRDGRYRIVTQRPGPLPWPGGGAEAPHLDVSVFARGLLDRVVTRIYFPDEHAANAADPVLAAITPDDRRATLLAVAEPGAGPAAFRFDIRLQGGRETVFFDV
ncbi:MAG: protocatechuate 3,4-dioxygenase subunit alpha [Streptosporangiaceae bacterium]